MLRGNLDLTVSVADVIDPERFRREFLFGTVQQASVRYGDFVSAASHWIEAPVSFPRPTTAAEAQKLVETLLRGNLPDESVRAHLLYQLDRLGTQIGVRFEVRRIAMAPLDDDSGDYHTVLDRVPWVKSDTTAYTRIVVPGPVLGVYRIRFVTDNVSQWTAPLEYVTVANRRTGTLVLPGTDSFPYASPLATSRGATNLFASALRMNEIDTRPGVWAVDYLTGPSADGVVGHVPIAVQYQVYCQAAVHLLSLSSTILTKGISNQSRTADGVTYSISLTNTAMYDINSALEIILDKMGDKLKPATLQRRLVGIRCAAL